MASIQEQELSHYLWSLDTALSNLISLSNDERALCDRIIESVDERLSSWRAHKLRLEVERDGGSMWWNGDGDGDGTDPLPPTRPSPCSMNSAVRAWGDCSDDEYDAMSFPEPKGLCKATAAERKRA